MIETQKKIQCQIVVYNDGKTIVECLESILSSKFTNYVPEYLIIDNCSTDGSIERIKSLYADKVEVITLSQNVGFAGGHNFGIEEGLRRGCDFVAILNPDLLLNEDCIERLADSLSVESKIGISCPKLYRTTKDFCVDHDSIDATGMYFLPSMRHLDRTEDYDSHSLSPVNLYNDVQFAIGASGACFVISRECIESVSFPEGLLEGGNRYLFDPDFFVYREDAELALRSQWFSWKTIYQPKAVGYHKRFVRPENRKQLPENYNRMSVRNRFLFQGNDISIPLFILTFPSSFLRNLIVIVACFIQEKSSLPGLKEVFTLKNRTWIKRKWIFKNRTASSLILFNWFKREYAFPPALSRNLIKRNGLEEKRKVRISAVIINYHQSGDLKDCLNSLKEIEPENYELDITVVNNSRDDFGVTTLKNNFDKIKFIDEGKNFGFSGAINLALNGSDSDICLVLNPDIILNRTTFISCLKVFDTFENVGAVSPLLIDSVSNEVQLEYSVKRFPRLITLLAELPGLKYILPDNSIGKFQHYRDDVNVSQGIKNQKGIYEIEQLAGACLFISRDVLKKVKGFGEEYYPAWFEDVDFAKKLYRQNFISAINCECTVIHRGGTSTNFLAKSEFLYIYYKNYLIFWRKYHHNAEKIFGVFLISVTFLIKRLSNCSDVGLRDIFKHLVESFSDFIKLIKS